MKKILTVLLIMMGLGILAAATFFAIEPEMVSLVILLVFLALLLIDAICYFVAAWGISKGVKWLYWPTIGILGINISGLVFDNIGFVDISVALFNILILILLIVYHKHEEKK